MDTNQEVSDASEKMVRLGLASKGVVYSLIGVLAFLTAIGGAGGQTTGKQGALKWLLQESYGAYLVALIALGLFFYAIWRLVQAWRSNAEDAKGIAKRIGRAGSGILYGAFAVFAAKLAIDSFSGGGGSTNGGGGSKQTQIIQELLQQSWGQYVLIGIGIIIIGRSLYLGYQAISGKYKKKVESYKIDDKYKSYLIKSGMAGYIARGIVFSVIGYFIIKAGIQHDASQATQGTGAAMDFIQGTGGIILMLAVAVGLICYGIFMFMQARYRDIESIF
ncbi:MAG: DUF1206 domain-containing protein [Candidatus Cyclobacteriaceae bacterium M2_1C_046]